VRELQCPPELTRVDRSEKSQAITSAAEARVADMWHWRCCNGRYSGGLAITQAGEQLRGIFLGDQGMGTYVDGTIEGQRLVFTRRWLNGGRPYSQIYTAVLSDDGLRLTGSFIETHAPGPSIDFDAERRFQPDLHDFNPVSPADGVALERLLPQGCDCSRPCGCSGIPQLMNCHNACGCPACPPGIP